MIPVRELHHGYLPNTRLGHAPSAPDRSHSCPGQLPRKVSMPEPATFSVVAFCGVLWSPRSADTYSDVQNAINLPPYSVPSCVRKPVQSATSPADYPAGPLKQFQSEEAGHPK